MAENESVKTSISNEYGFTDEELSEFQSDDRTAGRSIAKILTMLFIYTMMAMSVVIWWTVRTVF